MRARAHVTSRIPAGTVWMRDGWSGLNTLTSGDAVLPDAAVDVLGFSAGQPALDARVEAAPLVESRARTGSAADATQPPRSHSGISGTSPTRAPKFETNQT